MKVLRQNDFKRDSGIPTTGKPPKSSAAPSKSAAKTLVEDPFQRYMKKNYFEHFRRVMSWRRAARWVVLTYPLISALSFAAPFGILAVVARKLYQMKPEWFVNFISPDTQPFVMPVLYGLFVIALLFGLAMGIGLGISRARLLTFEAERTELAVRQSYFLKRIARGHRRSGKTGRGI
ncbi:hypothetical protein EBR21_15010 [bacterium]|nr:hypothetical protein [bacterium]